MHAQSMTISSDSVDARVGDRTDRLIRQAQERSGPSLGDDVQGERSCLRLVVRNDALVHADKTDVAIGRRRGKEVFRDLHRVPYPTEALSSRLREHVDNALAERDAESLLVVLMLGSGRIPESERCLAAWLPALIGLQELRSNDRPLAHEQKIHRHIREEVRKILANAANEPWPTWVVPVDTGDSCDSCDSSAAHVAALIMTQNGYPARPWLWRIAPPSYPYVTVGSRLTDPGAGSRQGEILQLQILGSDWAGTWPGCTITSYLAPPGMTSARRSALR